MSLKDARAGIEMAFVRQDDGSYLSVAAMDDEQPPSENGGVLVHFNGNLPDAIELARLVHDYVIAITLLQSTTMSVTPEQVAAMKAYLAESHAERVELWS